MNYNNLCYRCFCEKPIMEKACPKCGYIYMPNSVSGSCLNPGTVLHNRYIVGITLGMGGFGITYKCLDTKICGICAIKEYLPSNYAQRMNNTKLVYVAGQNLERYNKIMKRFVEEAELVKTLHHKNIITIYDSFFENNTAYYVMEYCNGIDLKRYTNDFKRKLTYGEGMNLLYQIMNGLEYIHSKGILHRDIAPDNIYVTNNNFIKILDFGSARREMDQFNRELSVIVKVGYAPIEQYGGRGKQGAYTDIYALGATFYHLFTGKMPIESTQRVADDSLVEFSRLRPDLPDNLKYCIEKSMRLKASDRISSIAEMKSILGLTPLVVTGSKQTSAVNSVSNESSDVKYVSATPKDKNKEDEQKHEKNDYSVSDVKETSKPSIGIRMLAYFIDLFGWFFIYFVVILSTGAQLDFVLIFPFVFVVVNSIIEILFNTSVGKAIFNLRIKGKTSENVSPSQILMRNIIKTLTIFVVMFSKNGDLLEDRATDTVVYRKG